MSKKAIGPVVATSLLLVVAVVSLVSFQSWYSNFGSNLVSNAEIKGTGIDSLIIQDVVGDVVYVKSDKEINLTKVQFGGRDCELNPQLEIGVNQIDIGSCSGNISTNTPEVVLVSGTKVISKKVFKQDRGVPIWIRTFSFGSSGNDVYWSLERENKGGVLITGQRENSSERNGIVKLYDSKGNLEWVHVLQEGKASTDPRYFGIMQHSNLNIFVGGTANVSSSRDFFVNKLSPLGEEAWNYSVDQGGSNSFARSIVESTDNNVIVVGRISNSTHINLFLVKLNEISGEEIWNRTIRQGSGSSSERLNDVLSFQNGSYMAIGRISNTDRDLFMLMFNESGHTQWDKAIDINGNDEYKSGILSNDGNILLIGKTNEDIIIHKINTSGENIWNRTIDLGDGVGSDSLGMENSIIELDSGEILISGLKQNASGRFGVILKLNSTGSPILNLSYTGDPSDFNSFTGIVKSQDGGFFSSGYYHNGADRNAVLIKMDSEGTSCSFNLLDGDCSGFR